MYYKHIFLLYFLFLSTFAFGQLSVGGFPLQVEKQKSSETQVVRMPILEQAIIDRANAQNKSVENILKPLKFAHAFDVKLNPSNSGMWYLNQAKYNVWQLTIQSDNAKSINLIFNKFKLRKGARLFMYSEQKKHYLGAFTVKNNKPSGKFAIPPIKGDEITIQYEVPDYMGLPSDFEIVSVNHDFMGILKSERRPFNGQAAGSCNVDANCTLGDKWSKIRNSACRLIVNGDELCSGTLVNNTAEDKKPYVLSASHCYDKWEFAETTVYTFNYESPYCAPIDGDPIHTLSGAVMKAQFDSLDFALAELDEIPPPEYRPFYAGWNRTGNLPDSSVSIHHPVGDIKKIAIDYDSPEYATFESTSVKNPENGSLKILEWDEGVTEIGSSGGGLFNSKQQLVGTLSGGVAVCGNPVIDYYARFSMQWDYKADSSKQLKHWLDPIGNGSDALEGKDFNAENNLCKAFTNLNSNDQHGNVGITVAGNPKGYWGGTNTVGMTEIVERFSVPGNEVLNGISFGVGKLILGSRNSNSKITIKVYNGGSLPERLIYSKDVKLTTLTEAAMNFISFDAIVEPEDTFFVGFELSSVQTADTFAIYQSLRTSSDSENCFYYKANSQWNNFKSLHPQEYSMVSVMELLACNVGNLTDTPIVRTPVNVSVYPNPVRSQLTVESDLEINPERLSVYNLLGQQMEIKLLHVEKQRIKLSVVSNVPGIYFIRFNYKNTLVARKFSFVP